MSSVPSRRSFLLGGAGLAAGLLAACSSDGDGTDPSATTSRGASAGFPVSVPGKEGSLRLTAPPDRVVAVGFLRDTDLALALGANLVGLVKNINFPSGLAPWQKPATSVARLDATDGLPFELIRARRPDLLMAADYSGLTDDGKSLRGIAPTLGYRTAPNQDDWKVMTTRAGTALGKADRAKQLIERTTAASVAVARKYPQLEGKTFTIGPVNAPDQIFTVSRTADASAQFFAQLGMTLSPKVQKLPQTSIAGRSAISPERLQLLDADVLIIGFRSAEIRRDVEGSALFRSLPAVRRGSYVPLSITDAIALGFPSVLSIPYALQKVVPRVAAAAAKAG